MSDNERLIRLIKQAALDAVNASKPSGVYFGKVISVSPLKIQIEQKLILGVAQLVLTRNVTDYTVETTTDGEQLHSHRVTVHNALQVGEKVVLYRLQGGQKFIVADRIGKGDEQ